MAREQTRQLHSDLIAERIVWPRTEEGARPLCIRQETCQPFGGVRGDGSGVLGGQDKGGRRNGPEIGPVDGEGIERRNDSSKGTGVPADSAKTRLANLLAPVRAPARGEVAVERLVRQAFIGSISRFSVGGSHIDS